MDLRFIDVALSCDLIGKNSDVAVRYTEFVADRLCVAVGLLKLFGYTNLSTGWNLVSLPREANCSEKRVGANVMPPTTGPRIHFIHAFIMSVIELVTV